MNSTLASPIHYFNHPSGAWRRLGFPSPRCAGPGDPLRPGCGGGKMRAMGRCPSCASEISEAARDCPTCGAGLERLSASPTRADARPGEVRAEAAGERGREGAFARRDLPTSSSAIEDGQFLPGSLHVGRYRIIGLLGRGGMGEVYRADDLKLGQPVALKFLPDDLARNESGLRRFLGEVRLARQICAGLQAAHERGVLHRDLKPANVMIDGRGKARITDFGLAVLASDLGRGTDGASARAVAAGPGTPAYMAPEQMDGRDASARSDVFALGLVLYEMFTGKRAFAAATIPELVRLHQESTPASPRNIVEGIDPAIERAILRCLE